MLAKRLADYSNRVAIEAAEGPREAARKEAFLEGFEIGDEEGRRRGQEQIAIRLLERGSEISEVCGLTGLAESAAKALSTYVRLNRTIEEAPEVEVPKEVVSVSDVKPLLWAALRDRRDRATERATEAARDEGKVMGHLEGYARGRDRGLQTSRRAVARELFHRGFELSEIAELTALPEQIAGSLRHS
jgi:predicted transcriptional regulator